MKSVLVLLLLSAPLTHAQENNGTLDLIGTWHMLSIGAVLSDRPTTEDADPGVSMSSHPRDMRRRIAFLPEYVGYMTVEGEVIESFTWWFDEHSEGETVLLMAITSGPPADPLHAQAFFSQIVPSKMLMFLYLTEEEELSITIFLLSRVSE